jgi:hypothetical protein
MTLPATRMRKRVTKMMKPVTKMMKPVKTMGKEVNRKTTEPMALRLPATTTTQP